MTNSAVQGYDIIGDVHGCAAQLEALLVTLGYQIADGTGECRHPRRQAIFVGDLIDRGEQQLRALQLVRAMVDAGSALVVMGNHEYNALAYHAEHPPGSGKYLRAHDDPDKPWSEKNTTQHAAFLEQVHGADRRSYLEWFATMPLWLDLDGLRVVHACWHDESIALVQRRCGTSAPFGDLHHLVAASDEEDALHRAVETLLKGPEISLVDHGQPEYVDTDRVLRGEARMRWWDSKACTLRDIAEVGGHLTTALGDPYPQLPDIDLPDATQSYVYTGGVPVFYGHYWRRGVPKRGQDWTDFTACVDFSAVKPAGALTAYRWSGESCIRPDHYVQCGDR